MLTSFQCKVTRLVDLDEVGGFASTGAAMLGFGTPMVATAGRVESGAILRSR